MLDPVAADVDANAGDDAGDEAGHMDCACRVESEDEDSDRDIPPSARLPMSGDIDGEA